MNAVHPDLLFAEIARLPTGRRHLVAIAGPPAAGKSTLVRRIAEKLNASGDLNACVLEMDGYHYDDRILRARNRLHRKGAPDTFDVGGLAATLDRLINREESEVAVPVFDRGLEVARAGAEIIPQAAEIILVEGNYLLIEQSPWNALRLKFDLTAFIGVGEDELRQRLAARWVSYGLNQTEIQQKIEQNDLPNGLHVLRHSVSPDILVDGTGDLSQN